MDDVDQEISWIDEIRTDKAKVILEVIQRILGPSLVNDSALDH